LTYKKIYIGITNIALLMLGAFSAAGVSAQSYSIDQDALYPSPAALQGNTMRMDGGVLPAQTYGRAPSYVMEPLQAGTYCGDGQRQAGEECDGSDMPAGACAAQGFTSGSPGCSDSCTLDTSSCLSGTSSASSAAAEPSTGHTSGHAGEGGASASVASHASSQAGQGLSSERGENASLSFLPSTISSAPSVRPPRYHQAADVPSSDAQSAQSAASTPENGIDARSSSRSVIGSIGTHEGTPSGLSLTAALLSEEGPQSMAVLLLLLSCIAFEALASALLQRMYGFRRTYETLPVFALLPRDLLPA
jgi:hypothetical protein